MEAVSGTAFVVATILKTLVFFVLLLLGVALATYMERKVAGFMQDRSGPNRVGPLGILQVMADGLKFILKEEVTPGAAHKKFFVLAPALALFPATVLFGVIPLGSPLPTPWGRVDMIVADVPVGFLYVLAIASLAVYGVVMAGWASNSKYSFLGGLRGSAQMISYEIGLAMSLVPVLMLAGNVRMPVLVSMQQSFGAGPATYGMWFILPLLVAAFFFVVSGLAETNRMPFDLPEAEAEIVGGYHTEYSSMKFGMFFLGEYFHLITTAALITVFFLGGWDIPFWSGDNVRVLADGTVVGEPTWWKTILTLLAFTAKTVLLVAFFMFVRWTIPRFRYDQLMDLGWKVFIPALMAYIMFMAVAIYALDSAGVEVGLAFSAALFGINLLLALFLLFLVDRGRLVKGATAKTRKTPRAAAAAAAGAEGD
ncbi:MAG: NADH-quinone oxidoreductase subunit H [marine benthic group bacterium]|jgi:NADH-quinone oxidoreductase subunit H|nr:NADH-quinone oxidoreductase subunit H [Candidatus Benthicola marisminoris]